MYIDDIVSEVEVTDPSDQTDVVDVDSEEIPFRFEITSYGADYPVDSVIKRIKDEVIFVPPFQRKYVWNIVQASKFIESLILGLPVPGVFLSRENETGRLLIVDGQQRLMSLFHFYTGIFGSKKFALTGLSSEDLNGKTYQTLSITDRTRLDDAIIHATIVRQDEPNDEESSIYLIFERLNTGGKPLMSQEIRACIYYGSFNEFLNQLQQLPAWRLVFGKENDRLKEQELILRFFALYYDRSNYAKPLKGFLNKFMTSNRNLNLYPAEELMSLFENTISIFNETLGNKAFRIGRQFNAAIFDATMVGLAERLKTGIEINKTTFSSAYNQLINTPDFVEKTKGGTSDDKVVSDRITMAIEVFQSI